MSATFAAGELLPLTVKTVAERPPCGGATGPVDPTGRRNDRSLRARAESYGYDQSAIMVMLRSRLFVLVKGSMLGVELGFTRSFKG